MSDRHGCSTIHWKCVARIRPNRVGHGKHIVDSISISQTNGSLLASSTGNGASEVITASALFNYVQSEIPKSEVVLIKASPSWNMLFKYNSKIFIIKAPMHLTTIELRAISNEVEEFLIRAKKEADAPAKG